MSQSSDGDDRPSREVAWRVFAAEFDDADYQYAESDEERAPNYVVTPTGARVNRLFAVGVLTSVEQVNDDVIRARIVDPTGAFVVYAGQYQPDALASLENADVPSFVAVTGKARTFSPDDSDAVYTSIRPESVNAVTAETRDRWVVTTAERTLARIATFADALDRPERGEDLTAALADGGVPHGLMSGIAHAIDHYGTTPAYLAAVRELALDATRVVAGEKDEVADLDSAPDEGDGTDADLSYSDAGVEDAPMPDEHVEAAPDDETAGASPTDTSPDDVEPDAPTATESDGDGEPADESATADADDAAETATESDADTTESTADETAEDASATSASDSDAESEADADEAADEAADADEEWEMDEETRAEVEEEFDVGFSTGDDIPEGGEADIDVEPAADAEADGDDSALGDFEDAAGDDDPETVEEFTEEEYDEPESAAEDAESAPPDLDLEDVVVDYMDELDDGNGADRDELVRTVLEETEADEDSIEDAIQSALMSGRCYESGDDHLKAI
ncbi:MAG: RPA family protein [Halarchaeum sp.]